MSASLSTAVDQRNSPVYNETLKSTCEPDYNSPLKGIIFVAAFGNPIGDLLTLLKAIGRRDVATMIEQELVSPWV